MSWGGMVAAEEGRDMEEAGRRWGRSVEETAPSGVKVCRLL